jgi:ABC-type oligopeptide transport system ATPase subunit
MILDEPTSAIDVSVQAQILNLLQELQREFHLTYLFISHNLGVVQHISDRITVMYLGKVVELSTSESIFSGAFHQYTEALLSSTPIPDPDAKKKRIILEGIVPLEDCIYGDRYELIIDELRKRDIEILEEMIELE